MALIPSYGKWPSTPDAGAAFVGGFKASADAASDAAALRVRQQAIAADAAQASARIQLGYQQLAQEAVQSKMELQAKQQFQQQQAMKQAQEAEIEQAYRQTQIGFKERELKNEEAITGMRLQEAAQGFQASQNFNRIYQQRLAAGDSEDVAQRTAARSAGPEMSGFAQGISGGGRAGGPALDLETKTKLEMLKQRIGEKRREIMKTPETSKETWAPLIDSVLKDERELEELLRSTRPAASIAPPSNLPPAPAAAVPQPPASMYFGQQPAFQVPQAVPQATPRTNQVGRFKIISR